MDTKDKSIIGLAIVLVLAVVLLVSGAFTTGKAVTTCTDTDGGDVSTIRGTISGTTEGGNSFDPQTDTCASDSILIEYSCDLTRYSGYKRDPSVYCAGGCVNGACL